MADTLNQNMLQNQQLNRNAAVKESKASTAEAVKTTQFADIMKSKAKSGSTTKMLAENPVAGQEVVKNAISGQKGGKGKLAVAANANTATTGTTTASSTTNNNTTDAALQGSGSTSATQLLNASYQMQEMNQEFNLQYLNLQQNVQADSRQFTALSNVSKTKSDTAKNSLSNVK